MADRHYLDLTGLSYFWNRLKNIFLYKLTNTNSDVIYLDRNSLNGTGSSLSGDAHLSLLAISDNGNTKTLIDRILPAGSTCLSGSPSDTYLITAAAAACIARRCASNQNAFSNIAVSGQTTVAADTPTDTVTLIGGKYTTIKTNATSDSVTICSTLNFNSPLYSCVSDIGLVAMHTTSADASSTIKCIIGSNTTNLTTTGSAGDTVRSANDTIPTTGAVTALINKATEGIATDTTVATKIQDVRLNNCGILLYSKNGSTYTDIATSEQIVDYGINVLHLEGNLVINCKSIPIHIAELNNACITGLVFEIGNCSTAITSNTDTNNPTYVAPTWSAMKSYVHGTIACNIELIVGSCSSAPSNSMSNVNNPYLNLIVDGAVSNSHRLVGSGATTVTYASGEIVINTTDNDTKNTAGVSSNNCKLYLIGSKNQTSGTAVTNTGTSAVYTQSGYLYSTTPTSGDNSTKVATTSYVDSAVATASSGAIHFCGILPAENTLKARTDLKKGTYWLVDTGTCSQVNYSTSLGILEMGDLVYHTTDCATFKTQDFTVVQSNLSRITCSYIDGLS